LLIGYLKIIAQLIIVVDLQINQCKVSITLLAFSRLTKVQSQLKVRTFRLSPVQKRVFAAVILVIWPQFKTRGISSRGKKVHLSALVLTRGISHHYCLGSDTKQGIQYVKILVGGGATPTVGGEGEHGGESAMVGRGTEQ